MEMRVTDSMRTAAMREAQTGATARLYKASQVASTGKKVDAPADDPAAFARLSRADASLAGLAARKTAMNRAQDGATVAESALASAADLMSRARELSIQMADGSVGPEERAAAAKEVTLLRQSLVGIANTRGESGYVFGGSRTDAEPFSATTGAFSGNDDSLKVEVADGVTMRANASGARAFTAAGGRDIFADLSNLATALTNDDVAGIQAAVGFTEAGRAQITRVRSDAGIAMDKLETSLGMASASETVMQKARASDAEADATDAFSALGLASQAYERSLEVSRKILATFDLQNR